MFTKVLQQIIEFIARFEGAGNSASTAAGGQYVSILRTGAIGGASNNVSGGLLLGISSSVTAANCGIRGTYEYTNGRDLELFTSSDNSSAPTNKMVIKGGGNVGIGTDSPTVLVHALDSGTKISLLSGTVIGAQASTTTATNCFYSAIAGNAGISALVLGDTDDNDQARVQFNNSGRLLQMLNAGAGITIDSSGDVGIGTTSPDTKLTVDAGATNTALKLISTDSKVYIAFSDDSTTTVPAIGGDDDDLIFNTGSERMRIESDGKIQVGSDKVIYAGGYGGALVIRKNDATADRLIKMVTVDSTGAIANDNVLVVKGSSVGIGTDTPTATLQVTGGAIKIGSGAGSGTDSDNMSIQVSNVTYGDTASLGLLVRNNGANNDFAQIGFGYSESKCPVVIGSVITSGASATKGDFIIGTRSTTTGSDAPTERMRIDSSGNVGIGTNSPQPWNSGRVLHIHNPSGNSSELPFNRHWVWSCYRRWFCYSIIILLIYIFKITKLVT